MSWSLHPKCPFPCIFAWPTLPHAFEFRSLTVFSPSNKTRFPLFYLKALFFSFLVLIQLEIICKLIYWIAVLHQTLCSLQAGITSVLPTSVYLEFKECWEHCRCSANMCQWMDENEDKKIFQIYKGKDQITFSGNWLIIPIISTNYSPPIFFYSLE